MSFDRHAPKIEEGRAFFSRAAGLTENVRAEGLVELEGL
jgi:hypothetical protein